MEEQNRSICVTCYNQSFCVLTTDKSDITSCSEYENTVEFNFEPKKRFDKLKKVGTRNSHITGKQFA